MDYLTACTSPDPGTQASVAKSWATAHACLFYHFSATKVLAPEGTATSLGFRVNKGASSQGPKLVMCDKDGAYDLAEGRVGDHIWVQIGPARFVKSDIRLLAIHETCFRRWDIEI